jgi:hypothetical protein
MSLITTYNDFCIIPQKVTTLPTKRLFDPKSRKLREVTKLPKELEMAENEVILRVRMVGINFQTDLKYDSRKDNIHDDEPLPKSIVPCGRIIGKVVSNYDDQTSKYVVFPYSNCITQNITPQAICHNCQYRKNHLVTKLSSSSYTYYKQYPCTLNLTYGYTLDGGLQDYMKIRNPKESLLKIPNNMSIHDCCFFMDIMLPFYSFLKDNFEVEKDEKDEKSDNPTNNTDNDSSLLVAGKVLIILNSISKDVNEVLIVIKHFKLDQRNINFIDEKKLDKLSENDRMNYQGIFSQVFVFKVTEKMVKFADFCSISSGLESTKSRYNIVFFDDNSFNNKYLNRYHNDKTYHQYKLSYKDKLNAEDLLSIVSNLNLHIKRSPSSSSLNSKAHKKESRSKKETRPSIASLETTASTFSSTNLSFHSDASSTTSSKSNTMVSKNLRFRENDSNIENSKKDPQTHYSWLWYDKDYDLCNEFEHSDDEDLDKKVHSVREINRILRNPKDLSRVCYTIKSTKPKLNALIC